MYSVSSFGRMIADRVRVDAYAEALRRAITPGCVVVEIGAGTGFFTLMACRLGAGHVYAIETNPAIRVAEAAAAENWVSDRITFLQKMSTEVELPVQADVLLSDLRGVLPLYKEHIPSIVDARRRLLKPGGVQIPGVDHVYAGLVGSAIQYRTALQPWEEATDGWKWSAGRNIAVNRWWKDKIGAEDLLSEGQRVFTLDYRTIENPSVSGKVMLSPPCAGTAYGLAVWFATDLYEGVGFSLAPGQADAVYGRAFFPFETPVELAASDSVQADLYATFSGGEYIWSWKTKINGKPTFTQSQFREGMSLERSIRQSAVDFRPKTGAEGRIVRWILERMDGESTNQQLARELQIHFPAAFATEGAALERVISTVRAYGAGAGGKPEPLER